MKVYFGFTVAGNRSAIETARHVVRLLEDAGHEVLTRHLVSDDVLDSDRRCTPQEIYSRDMNWLRECDLFIAEVSGSSFGIGYEAGYLLGTSAKRAILFYRREVEGSISLLITGNTHPNCTLVPYSDPGEVEDFVRGALKAGFSPPLPGRD
jgi:2'-deoxynucleoside 5'-phosphate N-hydrolase